MAGVAAGIADQIRSKLASTGQSRAPASGSAPTYSAASPSERGHASAPFSESQKSWLDEAVADSLGTALAKFGEHLDGELSSIRTDVAAIRFEAREASASVAGIRPGMTELQRTSDSSWLKIASHEAALA